MRAETPIKSWETQMGESRSPRGVLRQVPPQALPQCRQTGQTPRLREKNRLPGILYRRLEHLLNTISPSGMNSSAAK